MRRANGVTRLPPCIDAKSKNMREAIPNRDLMMLDVRLGSLAESFRVFPIVRYREAWDESPVPFLSTGDENKSYKQWSAGAVVVS